MQTMIVTFDVASMIHTVVILVCLWLFYSLTVNGHKSNGKQCQRHGQEFSTWSSHASVCVVVDVCCANNGRLMNGTFGYWYISIYSIRQRTRLDRRTTLSDVCVYVSGWLMRPPSTPPPPTPTPTHLIHIIIDRIRGSDNMYAVWCRCPLDDHARGCWRETESDNVEWSQWESGNNTCSSYLKMSHIHIMSHKS